MRPTAQYKLVCPPGCISQTRSDRDCSRARSSQCPRLSSLLRKVPSFVRVTAWQHNVHFDLNYGSDCQPCHLRIASLQVLRLNLVIASQVAVECTLRRHETSTCSVRVAGVRLWLPSRDCHETGIRGPDAAARAERQNRLGASDLQRSDGLMSRLVIRSCLDIVRNGAGVLRPCERLQTRASRKCLHAVGAEGCESYGHEQEQEAVCLRADATLVRHCGVHTRL